MKVLSWSSKFFLLAGILSGMSACERTDPAIEQGWDVARIATLHLDLVDQDRVQEIKFSADGTASATFGDKNGAAPTVVYWTVADGDLVLSTTDSAIDVLTLVSESETQIVARNREGNLLTYRKL
jgi:hypothetical protein